jgi:hypothetical protein
VTRAGVNALRIIDPASDRVVADIPTGVSPHLGKSLGATVGAVVVQGSRRAARLRSGEQRRGALDRGRQAAALDGVRRQDGVGDERRLERPHRRRPRERQHEGDRGRQRAAQGRRPAGRRQAAPRPRPAPVSIANFAFRAGFARRRSGNDGDLAQRRRRAARDRLRRRRSAERPAAARATLRAHVRAAGTFAYNCSVHPYMQGKVTVQP